MEDETITCLICFTLCYLDIGKPMCMIGLGRRGAVGGCGVQVCVYVWCVRCGGDGESYIVKEL